MILGNAQQIHTTRTNEEKSKIFLIEKNVWKNPQKDTNNLILGLFYY